MSGGGQKHKNLTGLPTYGSSSTDVALGGSDVEGIEESMMKGGLTCGLSDIVVSIMSKYFHFFLLPVPLLLDLSFFPAVTKMIYCSYQYERQSKVFAG